MTPDALSRALSRSGLPDGLAWAVSVPDPGVGGLFPEERAAIARARPVRQAEFAGGRQAAHAALSRLGRAPEPIPVAPDRAPVWPEGVTGSITHAAGLCLAVVGWARDWRGIGVDLEADVPLAADLVPEIATEQELSPLLPLSAPEAAVRVFSAKEAAYKAQYAESRTLFGFDAMAADLPAGRMRMVQETGPGRGVELPMRQWTPPGLILSLCAWAR